ncbi:capsule biosynthesis GfcC family protein [Rheinheimera sp. MMS21-TC3]|nr:capsule biosynthesis GfcC family protein [Rheinheimera sp. MMS21-TC3]WNO59395.1 capsule biosynthesis GfcC family protein [Rheinheimera sp. MMS21-TC3]
MAQAEVKVQINQQLYIYAAEQQSQIPRLADVLAPVALTDNWYWPASALFKTDDNSAQLLQQKILQQLSQLQHDYATDADVQQALNSMTAQIQAWSLATRVLIPIDYDFARAKPSQNPRFIPGSYLLQLYKRPSQLSVFGLVQQPSRISYKNATKVGDYISDISRLAAADKGTLYVVQPDGRIIKVTLGAWQQQKIEAMPGAQLFVPFKPAMFSAKWQQLNQDILALARHRVLL